MADSNVPITPGSGANVDTRTATNGDHRQVIVIGNDGDNVAGVTAGASHSDINQSQKATYWVARGPASGSAPAAAAAPAAVANTDKILLVGHHPSTSTKTVKIRKITVGAILGTAVTYLYSVYRAAAAPAGGTAVTAAAALSTDPASDTQWMYQSTVALATQVVDGSIADYSVTSTTAGHSAITLYEWMPGSLSKPITLRPGVLDGIVICSRTTTATAPDAIITVEYTEE